MRDKRLVKPSFPDTKIGQLLEQADTLKYEKIYNYKYSYFTKTPNGMREDTEANHKYGEDREGYEDWKSDNPNLDMSYSGVTTVRTITTNKEVVGYMFEEKLPNTPWLEKIDGLLSEAWISFCIELNIVDEPAMEYFLFDGIIGDYRDNGEDRITKFKVLINCINKYNDEEEQEYKQLIDKIKG